VSLFTPYTSSRRPTRRLALCSPGVCSGSLGGNPANVAKKANKDKIIALYNEVWDKGLVTSAEDREAARLAKELEQKAKLEDKKANQDGEDAVAEEVDDGPKQYTINITKRNKEGRKPVKGDKVRVNYTGKLEDGSIFDSTMDEAWLKSKKRKGAALMFKIGANQVIRGWDECVRDMATGEKATVTIEPSWAYGKKGVPEAGIPPDARLIFDMELVTIV
jgi:FK506-binding protein 3